MKAGKVGGQREAHTPTTVRSRPPQSGKAVRAALVQVGIAIATIAIIAHGQRWPWYAAIALGVAGALVGAYAYI